MHDEGLAAADGGRKVNPAAKSATARLVRALLGALLLGVLSALHWHLGPEVPLLGTAAAFVQAAWPLWHRQREESQDVVYASFVAQWRAECSDALRVAAIVLPAWSALAWAIFRQGAWPSPSARSTVDVAFAFVGQWLTVAAPEEWFWRGYVQPIVVAYCSRPGGRGPEPGCPTPWRDALPLGAIVTAALFAFVHLGRAPAWQSAATFLPGLLFAALYMRRGRVLGASLLHALCNAISAAII